MSEALITVPGSIQNPLPTPAQVIAALEAKVAELEARLVRVMLSELPESKPTVKYTLIMTLPFKVVVEELADALEGDKAMVLRKGVALLELAVAAKKVGKAMALVDLATKEVSTVVVL